MQEIRVNPLDLTPEEQEKSRKQAELVFKINHTMPFAEEYDSLVKELFKDKTARTPGLGQVPPSCGGVMWLLVKSIGGRWRD